MGILAEDASKTLLSYYRQAESQLDEGQRLIVWYQLPDGRKLYVERVNPSVHESDFLALTGVFENGVPVHFAVHPTQVHLAFEYLDEEESDLPRIGFVNFSGNSAE